MGRDTSDEAYVLDLCDRVLGEVGSRQHRFDWLLGDPGRTGRRVRLPVDGFWAAANLVVEYRERQHDQPIPHFDKPERLTVSGVHRGLQRALYDARRDEVIPQHGIRLVIITPTHLDATPRGRLRRNETHDLPVLRRILTDLYARSAAKPCVGVDKSGVAANDQAGPPSERSGGGRSRLRHRTVTTARPPHAVGAVSSNPCGGRLSAGMIAFVRSYWRAGAAVFLLAVVGAGCSAPPSPIPEAARTVTVTVTSDPTRRPAPSPTGPAPTPTPTLETVDPAEYLRQEFGVPPGYGFNSPSGRLWCAIITELDESTPLKDPLVGCETEEDIPKIDCEEIQGRGEPGFAWAPAIEFYRGDSARPNCYHDGGLYGGQVLPYDHSLRVLGITCTSRRSGVTCVDDKTGQGFTAARAGFVAVG